MVVFSCWLLMVVFSWWLLVVCAGGVGGWCFVVFCRVLLCFCGVCWMGPCGGKHLQQPHAPTCAGGLLPPRPPSLPGGALPLQTSPVKAGHGQHLDTALVVVLQQQQQHTAKMCWGAVAPQTPLFSWRGSAPPDLPSEIRKWPESGYSFGGGACWWCFVFCLVVVFWWWCFHGGVFMLVIDGGVFQ